MKAKYTGECWRCGGSFDAGADIVWSRQNGARHNGCPARQEGEERVSFAERVERREERARDAADKREEWSQKAQGRSDTAFSGARDAVAGIPPGQPILVGHHSEKRHRAALKRQDNRMRRGFEEGDKAKRHAGAAQWYEHVANRRSNPVYLSNRLEEARRNIRDVERRLQGAGMIEPGLPTGARKDQLDGLLAEYREQAEYWESQLQEAGGLQYSRENVSKGDLVMVRGTLSKVLRANPKTVTVLYLTGASVGWYWMKYPYAEIKEHVRAEDMTDEQRELVASVKSLKGSSGGIHATR